MEQETRPRQSRIFLLFFFIAVILAVAGAFTLIQRRSQYHALAKETETLAVPTVSVIHAPSAKGQEDLVLPGTMQAYVESPIYARTSGYVKKWYHDIGTRVKQGEQLADIDTPEVDQQLSQARADLATAQANANLSKITAARYQELIKTDGVSKQEVDNAVGDLAAKEATVNSAQANVRRLEELEGFKHVVAPFSGVVTRRQTDIGQLVNAGNGGASQELFSLAQTDPLRVYVNVPEAYAPAIHPGLGAYLELTQYAGRKFEGKVVRTAESIDLASRTLLTEVDVPNHAGELLPGGYAQVHLAVQLSGEHVQVPVNALLFRSEGLRAVVVDSNHKLHLQPLTIGRDYGTSLEVLQGLSSSDWIVLNPADSLEDGQQVNVKEVTQKPAAPAPAPASAGAKPGAKS
ncbi:MAG TPA: efflux RND transporter periplasmic adaptor subunit [Candidatus Dormibacteraeota bacterium]|jgi:RND family efflux transporter MFP subunit|nr:efflux RND transporter periplasmic adaptor subunit [Candidatus Dormibacteraeota bacterium]